MMGMSLILQYRRCWFGVATLLILVCSETRFGEAYKNYTVGDSLGWYDDLIKPGVDYQKWADSNSFSLGDFLIFNTDNNHSVVQTYNFTSYKSCDYTGEDSVEWGASEPSSTAVYPNTIAVPLLKEGPTYFFSSDYDGWQCQHGTKFEIKVSHGQGLPSIAPSPSEADSGDDDSVPVTIIPGGNFNHPKNPGGGGGGDNGGDGGGGEEANVKSSECGSVLVGRLSVFVGILVVLINV